MSAPDGLRLAGGLVAAAEAVLGVLLAGTVLAPYFWATGVATITVTWVAARFMRPLPPPPRDDGPGCDPEPPWWPDFERGLREYEDALRAVDRTS